MVFNGKNNNFYQVRSEDYQVKLQDAQAILTQATQAYLKKNQRKRGVDGGPKDVEVTKFSVRDYVLPTSSQGCIVDQ